MALSDLKHRGLVRPMHVTELMENPEADLDNITLGASQASDFTWKQLLDSVSCTECARCTSVCPAYATGRPLSPMKLIIDIRSDLYDRTVRESGRGRELLWAVVSRPTSCGLARVAALVLRSAPS